MVAPEAGQWLASSRRRPSTMARTNASSSTSANVSLTSGHEFAGDCSPTPIRVVRFENMLTSVNTYGSAGVAFLVLTKPKGACNQNCY